MRAQVFYQDLGFIARTPFLQEILNKNPKDLKWIKIRKKYKFIKNVNLLMHPHDIVVQSHIFKNPIRIDYLKYFYI